MAIANFQRLGGHLLGLFRGTVDVGIDDGQEGCRIITHVFQSCEAVSNIVTIIAQGRGETYAVSQHRDFISAVELLLGLESQGGRHCVEVLCCDRGLSCEELSLRVMWFEGAVRSSDCVSAPTKQLSE